ncbi:hypothetical protein MycrhDRAFT_1975 [Mycolicibacterium rhodesiae JS60]|nr:hypothetical protein MycrhDRAFT_1975 [Mycolicibacterium rhodesiae JS60]
MTTTEENPCGRCAYGTDCTCAYYADWIITPPCPAPRLIRGSGYRTGYRDGWKTGYTKGFHEARQESKVA